MNESKEGEGSGLLTRDPGCSDLSLETRHAKMSCHSLCSECSCSAIEPIVQSHSSGDGAPKYGPVCSVSLLGVVCGPDFGTCRNVSGSGGLQPILPIR